MNQDNKVLIKKMHFFYPYSRLSKVFWIFIQIAFDFYLMKYIA